LTGSQLLFTLEERFHAPITFASKRLISSSADWMISLGTSNHGNESTTLDVPNEAPVAPTRAAVSNSARLANHPE